MLYVCLPSHNEGSTVGVLLWRIRKVFAGYSREYEVIVYDDASTDATRETLEPYGRVMPLTVIGGSARLGYARAVDALLRAASERTRYPRRDAVVLMQADFTDLPEHLPELVRRFEGGADLVMAERVVDVTAPEDERTRARLLRSLCRVWPFRSFVAVPGVSDPFGALRLIRLSVVRELLQRRATPAAEIPVPAANAELTRDVLGHARRAEVVPVQAHWKLRARPSRARPWREAIAVARRAWAVRGTRRPARTRSP